MNTIQVQFIDGTNRKIYDFKNNIKDLQRGDKVVVDTANGLQIAKVCHVLNHVTNKSTKWVIQRIDLDEVRYRQIEEEMQSLNQELDNLDKHRKRLMKRLYKLELDYNSL